MSRSHAAPHPGPPPGLILVAGSINADLVTRVAVHPRPGETVPGTGGEILPGGKGANQAVAAARMGGRVRMLGAVGSDPAAGPALEGLAASGADLTLVRTVPGPTGLAVVTVAADGENTIVVVPGANGTVDAGRIAQHASAIRAAAVVLSQGEIPSDGIAELARITADGAGRLLLNPAPVIDLPADVLRGADPLVVNEHEASRVLAMLGAPDSPAAPREVALALREHGIGALVLTLGAAGALVADGDGIDLVPAAPAEAVDTTGAGDAFIGALAVGLARGEGLREAARTAARVAAFAVGGHGAQPSYPSVEDVLLDLPPQTLDR